ncbi:MAG: PD-(D/E)XK nuclease family protein [Candidatus Zixiibacteriota bacterium]
MTPRHTLYLSMSEKTLAGRLFEDLRGAREAAPLAPAVVVVRSNLAGLQLSRRLAREAGGHANVRFLTLIDLARRLAGPGNSLPKGGGRAVLASLAADLERASYFGPVKGRPGFVDALGAAAEDVAQAGLGAWHADLNLGEKLALFGRLYDRYRGVLAGDGSRPPLWDEYDVFRAAAGRAPSFGAAFEAPGLSLFGFYDFNELQRFLLSTLATAVRLNIYMPYGDEPEFRFTGATREWLARLGVGAVPLDGGDAAGAAKSTRLPGSVKIVSAPDEEAEARVVAREVLRLNRESGVRFTETAVLYRDEAVLAALVEVFDAVRIPVNISGGRPLASTRAGDGIRRALELVRQAGAASRPFGRRDVMDFLATAPLSGGSGGGAAFEPALWDEISAAAGIVYGREAWAKRLARYAEICASAPEDKRRHDPADARALASYVEGLFAAWEDFPASARWGEFAGCLEDFVTDYFEANDGREAAVALCRDLAAYDEVVEAPVPLRTFAETVERLLRDTKLGAGSFERGGVHLIKTDNARSLRFRAVFIPAVCEGSYPRRPPQDPVLLDHERAEFNDRADGRWRFNLKAERAVEEPLLFRLALGTAEEFLHLSYHRMDGAGRERLPSHFLVRQAAILTGGALTADNFDRAAAAYPWFTRVGSSDAPPAEAALDEAEYWAGRARELGGAAVGASLAGADAGCAAAREAAASAGSTVATPYDGLIVSAEGREYLAGRFGRRAVAASPSDLETLAACPRKYLFEKVLALRAWEEAEEDLAVSPLARGKVVHDVLREYYRHPSAGGIEAEIGRLVGEALDALAAEGPTARPFALEMERRLLSEKLAAFVEAEAAADGDWAPTYVELRFGRRADESDDPASVAEPYGMELETAADGGGPAAAEIHGRIDRVDIRGDAARVLDYKTGSRDRHVANLDGGRQLQPALYLMAAGALFGLDPARSEAGYCFPLGRGEKYKWVISDKGPLDEAAVRHLVGGLLGLARDGVFVAGGGDSGGRTPCRHCDMRVICDVIGTSLGEAKWASAPASRLAELREVK